MIDIDIMQDASEIIHYDKPGIPLYIRASRLSAYPNMRALCHWHEDLEFIHILKGCMYYDVNGKKILLKEGDAIFINARQLHYGLSCRRQECEFIVFLFHPSLLSGCRPFCQQYLLPVTENPGLEYLHFSAAQEEQQQTCAMAQLLTRILALKEQGAPGYELEVLGTACLLLSHIYRQVHDRPGANPEPDCSDLAVQKTMVSYIYQHYQEKITLDEIAAAGNVCRSKCCSIFKHYLQQSPVDFLNAYRLDVSRHLLRQTDVGITQIAGSCGFNHPSYFSKLFLRRYGCTPSEYRLVQNSLTQPQNAAPADS